MLLKSAVQKLNGDKEKASWHIYFGSLIKAGRLCFGPQVYQSAAVWNGWGSIPKTASLSWALRWCWQGNAVLESAVHPSGHSLNWI